MSEISHAAHATPLEPPRRRPGRALARRIGIAVLLIVAVWLGLGLYSASGARRVFLVPLDADPRFLRLLREYYQRELGLDLAVLPEVVLTDDAWDPAREQFVAQRLTELIYRKYWRLRWPSRSLVIGVTSRDMYIEGVSWSFAFSVRHQERIGVASYARMDPEFLGDPPNEDLLTTRLRKIVSRDIAFMGYHLAPSDDPRSLLYRNVLGLEELDALEENLVAAGLPVSANAPR